MNIIHPIPQRHIAHNEQGIDWTNVPALEITHYTWDNTGYEPAARCQLVWEEAALHVKMTALEREIVSTYTQLNDPVSQESCMELFIAPQPERSLRYLNFEFSPLGTLLIGIGEQRAGRVRLPVEDYRTQFAVTPSLTLSGDAPQWSISWQIPLAFMQSHFPDFTYQHGLRMRANFYKCAVRPVEHYGSWAPIDTPKPDFHQPTFFGELELAAEQTRLSS